MYFAPRTSWFIEDLVNDVQDKDAQQTLTVHMRADDVWKYPERFQVGGWSTRGVMPEVRVLSNEFWKLDDFMMIWSLYWHLRGTEPTESEVDKANHDYVSNTPVAWVYHRALQMCGIDKLSFQSPSCPKSKTFKRLANDFFHPLMVGCLGNVPWFRDF